MGNSAVATRWDPHNIGSDAMEKNGASNGQDAKPQKSPPATGASKSPKKRRKVNHACVYCRRSHMTCDLERPCKRCIKRNIGHLCNDEPRDGHGYHKKSKADSDAATGVDETSPPKDDFSTAPSTLPAPSLLDEPGHNLLQDNN